MTTRLLLSGAARWTALSAGAAVVTIFLAWTEIAPRVMEAVHLLELHADQRALIRGDRDWEAELSRLERERGELEREFSARYVSMPRRSDFARVIQLLQLSALEANVTIVEIRPDARLAYETHDDLPVHVRFDGVYHSVGAFLHGVERADFLIRVREVRLALKRNDPARLTAIARLDVTLLH